MSRAEKVPLCPLSCLFSDPLCPCPWLWLWLCPALAGKKVSGGKSITNFSIQFNFVDNFGRYGLLGKLRIFPNLKLNCPPCMKYKGMYTLKKVHGDCTKSRHYTVLCLILRLPWCTDPVSGVHVFPSDHLMPPCLPPTFTGDSFFRLIYICRHPFSASVFQIFLLFLSQISLPPSALHLMQLPLLFAHNNTTNG